MPYVLVVLDRAWDDLFGLLATIPEGREEAIVGEIGQILDRFVMMPTTSRPPRLVVPLYFTADGVQYRWQAAWRYSKGETAIQITAFGRDPTTIL